MYIYQVVAKGFVAVCRSEDRGAELRTASEVVGRAGQPYGAADGYAAADLKTLDSAKKEMLSETKTLEIYHQQVRGQSKNS
jgi:hypothetical protein